MFNSPDFNSVTSAGAWANFLDGTSRGDGRIYNWQLRSPMEVEVNIEILRRVVHYRRKTSTGKAIFDRCKQSDKTIHFIDWRMRRFDENAPDALPGFTSFENDCPRIGEATIYVNLDLILEVTGESADRGHVALSRFFDTNLILLDEMGHASNGWTGEVRG